MFGLSPHKLPYCASYSDAIRFYEKSERYQRKDGWRGVISKRDDSKVMQLLDGVLACRYHSTDVVRLSPGKVHVNFYDSPSTVTFANAFLPAGLTARMFKGEMFVSNHDGYFTSSTNHGMDFDLENDVWVPREGQAMTFEACVLDRKKAAAVRKTLRPFLHWIDVTRRLKGEPPRKQLDGWKARHGGDDCYRKFMHCLTEGHIPYEAYPELAGSFLIDTKQFLPSMYCLGGAVSKVELPEGALRKRTGYDSLAALNFI